MRILASILVLLLSLSGCTAEVGGGTEPTPTPVDTTEPTPVAPDPELPAPESGWVDDGPTMPGNWQCLTCQGEGRQVYACGPMATTEGLEALGVCTGGVGPALGQDFAGCEGVWLDELGACMVPEATGVRSALVMCGVDSDDVAMVCEG